MPEKYFSQTATPGQNFLRLLFIIIALAILLCLPGTLTSCENGGIKNPRGDSGRFAAAVWNVQALFDQNENGNEYREYRESEGWTGEKYTARLLSIGRAILRMKPLARGNSGNENNGAPDLIGFVELENARVLDDLVRGPLSKEGYSHTFFASAPDMSLGIGVASRFPLTETKIHSITANGETVPRPILEIHLEPEGKPLVFFLCHWKSKLGNEAVTESLRRAAARVIRRRMRELGNEKPEAPVVVMGDLNENHDEFYRGKNAALTALLPDTQDAAERAHATRALEDYLVLCGEKPPRSRFFDSPDEALYTPWQNEIDGGSYFYRNNWETIDHILLSKGFFDDEGWEYESTALINAPPFMNAKGLPDAYIPRNGQGLSDHLPLLLFLRNVP